MTCFWHCFCTSGDNILRCTAWAHGRKELILGEGRGLSGGTIVNSSFKLGSYAGTLANLNLSGNIDPSPNLTTVYLYTPLVGPTLEPLECVPSPGGLGKHIRYPPTSTGTYIGCFRRHLPPPPPPYSTHPRMNPPTGRVQLRRVM